MVPIPIHAHNPGLLTGDGNWTWLLPGRTAALVDAGTGDARHLAGVAAALGGRPLATVLVTHGHGDHASGAPVLAAREPQARFLKMPWPDRDGRYAVDWRPLAEGDVIEAGDTTLVALHTPGHAPDHLCFWHAETRSVFCGDLMQQGRTIVIPGNQYGDVAAYIASLERVLALAPERAYPAHGPIIEQPARLLRNYLEHRREREAQVLDALRQGDSAVEAITARIYRGLPESLVAAARDSITAHLRKLEREGRARRDGEQWLIMNG